MKIYSDDEREILRDKERYTSTLNNIVCLCRER